MREGSRLQKFHAWRSRHLPHKYYVLALSIVTGLMAGAVAVILKNLVFFIQSILMSGFSKDVHNYFYFLYPTIGILVTVYFIRRFVKQPVSHGIPNTLLAISRRNSNIKRHNLFSSLITGAITVGFGGSCGLEGPTVVTSAAWSSNLSKFLNINYKTKTLLIGCAAAGAMSAMFHAPIAAIVFAVEVFMLDLTMVSMVPLLLASASAAISSMLFLGDEMLFHVKLKDSFSPGEIPYYILLGIFCGLIAVYFTKTYFKISALFERFKPTYPKAILGGILLGFFLFVLPPLYGEGFQSINALIHEKPLKVLETSLFYEYKSSFWIVTAFLGAVLLLKVFATTITFGAGGIGGIFAPSLFMGSLCGFLFARLINHFQWTQLSLANFTLVGMAGFMSGILFAPLTAIFLIAEITGGYQLFLPLMLTSSLAFVTVRYFMKHSIYTLQLAERGELITHDKDQAVLTLMKLRSIIESDFTPIRVEGKLSELIHAISASKRNIFPVVGENNKLYGIVMLDDVRDIMFDRAKHETVTILEVMSVSPAELSPTEPMESVMKKFDETMAWNLPVVENGIYVGFVSKSKLLSAYRSQLQEFYQED